MIDMTQDAQILQGDSLQMLADIPSASVDAVITDPPYIVGATSVGNSKLKVGTWADMENASYWFCLWVKECKRVLKPSGYLLFFGNWRSLPTYIRALCLSEMPATSCLVWDKEWIGPAAPQQLRSRFEVVLFSAMPEARIPDRSAPDIYKCKWMAGQMKTTQHPAEKPVSLMRYLISLVTHNNSVVLDPFAGSGTTGVACVLEGRRFIGIEREQAYVDIASQRIEEARQALLVAA